MRFYLTAARRKDLRTVALLTLACVLITSPISCAYFNKLYNAKKKFNEAKASPLPKDGSLSRQQINMYDEVIKKCQELLTTYPNSRWVDDAVLLIGKSYYEQRNYDNAILTLEALREDFPESELNEEALEYIARSYVAKEEPEKAVAVLEPFLELYPGSDNTAIVLYLLGTSSLKVGNEEKAMGFLGRLTDEYPGSPHRLKAELEMADIFLEKEAYEKSLSVYERLANSKLNEEDRIRCLMRLAETYVKLERFEKAKETIDQIDQIEAYVLPLEDKAVEELLKAETYVGLDSLDKAINLYIGVGASYPKTMYSAEGYYQLGIIHQEKLDSLETAKTYFEKVTREYAKSPFADDAVKRSSNISQLMRLQSSLGGSSNEGEAFTQFSLAEVQLFQFNNFKQALVHYEAVLDSFPESEVAPKAAYAIGYIYGILLGDTLRARESYEYLVGRFPDSQQAAYARQFLEKGKE